MTVGLLSTKSLIFNYSKLESKLNKSGEKKIICSVKYFKRIRSNSISLFEQGLTKIDKSKFRVIFEGHKTPSHKGIQ